MIIDNFKLIKYGTISSTNDEAKIVSSKFDIPVCIWTKKQTDGRGRFNRNWVSLKGNLAVSYILYPSIEIHSFQLYSIVSSLAVYDLFINLGINKEDLFIKWPNDVFLNNKKVSGILLELGKKNFLNNNSLIIGIGINLKNFPQKKEIKNNYYEAISLSSVNKKLPKQEQILYTLNDKLAFWNNIFIKKGFEVIKETFLCRTFKKDKKITVNFLSKKLSGFFCGISDDGCLLLKTKCGIKKISSGEIY